VGSKPATHEAENSADGSRLCLVGVKVDAALRREIDAYAEANGVSRSRAAGHYLTIARETIREREGVPSGWADELLEAVDGLRAGRGHPGPAHPRNAPSPGSLGDPGWRREGERGRAARGASHGGRRRGEQTIAEAERDLQETSGATEQKEKH
jgi:hypothetical protein